MALLRAASPGHCLDAWACHLECAHLENHVTSPVPVELFLQLNRSLGRRPWDAVLGCIDPHIHEGTGWQTPHGPLYSLLFLLLWEKIPKETEGKGGSLGI